MADNPLDDDLLKELGLDPDEMSKPLTRPTSAAQSTVGGPAGGGPAGSSPAGGAPASGGTNPGLPKPPGSSLPPGVRPRPPAGAGPAAPLQQPVPRATTPPPSGALRRPVGEHSLPPNTVPAPRAPAPVAPQVPEPVRFADNLKNLADDMPLQVVAVLGKKTMTLKEVVDLKHGEVVDLKKMPNDTIDLVANGKLVARGELVLIDGRVGIQIKQLVGN